MVQDPPERNQWMSGVPCPYSTSFTFFVHMGEQWYAPPIVMSLAMTDDSIYKGLSLVGNMRTSDQKGVGIIICYAELMT